MHYRYINANVVEFPGVPVPLRYVLHQACKDKTVGDTWQMYWQMKVELVVMLCGLNEKTSSGKPKCVRYWPDTIGNTVTYGTIRVRLVSVTV